MINNVIVSIGGSKYYVKNNVTVINIYVFDDGYIYRFGSSGAMLVGAELDGYVFDGDGRLTSDNKTIYMEIDGTVYEITGNIAKKHTHSYSENIIQPTCTNKGCAEHTCPCGSTYKDNEKPVISHNYVDYVCTMCGIKIKTSEGLAYTLNSDEQGYSVSGIGECADTDVVIPATYNGLPVTAIGNSVFRDCTSLKAVTIPDSVTNIGNYAFSGCSNLEKMAVEEGNIVYHSKGNCIIETASKTLIAGCQNSVIPTDGSVTSIGASAFSGRSGITSITIPSSVTSIGGGAFASCNNLKSITVENENTEYYIKSSCLIEAKSKTLVWGCENSIIPTDGSVTSIGDYAFDGCSSLTSITIPDSVTSIGAAAFQSCSNLTDITIPSSVTSIGEYAFRYCYNLKAITFKGTEEQWNAITKETDWDYNAGEYKLVFASKEKPEANPSEGLKFTLNSAGKGYTVSGIGTCTDTDVVIPATYNNLPVTAIGEKAFNNNKTITSITG